MKKLLALLLFPLLAAGCTKGEGVIEEMDGPDGVVLEAYMDLRVSDKQGHDLLDSVFQSPQSVDLSKVKNILREGWEGRTLLSRESRCIERILFNHSRRHTLLPLLTDILQYRIKREDHNHHFGLGRWASRCFQDGISPFWVGEYLDGSDKDLAE